MAKFIKVNTLGLGIYLTARIDRSFSDIIVPFILPQNRLCILSIRSRDVNG